MTATAFTSLLIMTYIPAGQLSLLNLHPASIREQSFPSSTHSQFSLYSPLYSTPRSFQLCITATTTSKTSSQNIFRMRFSTTYAAFAILASASTILAAPFGGNGTFLTARQLQNIDPKNSDLNDSNPLARPNPLSLGSLLGARQNPEPAPPPICPMMNGNMQCCSTPVAGLLAGNCAARKLLPLVLFSECRTSLTRLLAAVVPNTAVEFRIICAAGGQEAQCCNQVLVSHI